MLPANPQPLFALSSRTLAPIGFTSTPCLHQHPHSCARHHYLAFRVFNHLRTLAHHSFLATPPYSTPCGLFATKPGVHPPVPFRNDPSTHLARPASSIHLPFSIFQFLPFVLRRHPALRLLHFVVFFVQAVRTFFLFSRTYARRTTKPPGGYPPTVPFRNRSFDSDRSGAIFHFLSSIFCPAWRRVSHSAPASGTVLLQAPYPKRSPVCVNL